MRNPIHTVVSSSSESAGVGAFLASDGDRFVNVFDERRVRGDGPGESSED
jgi:hypothetical protein